MRAILIKSHWTLTADRAAIAEKVVGGIRVFGGLALNTTVGWLNPRAVEVALQMGAAQIWMPTLDLAGPGGYRRPGPIILHKDGTVRPEVFEILDLIRDADAILGSGHLAVSETIKLVLLARERGVRKILVTHPEAHFIEMPIAVQQERLRPGRSPCANSGAGRLFDRAPCARFLLAGFASHGRRQSGRAAGNLKLANEVFPIVASDW